jgi:NDP-sugar pyrophosphorylase family protein
METRDGLRELDVVILAGGKGTRLNPGPDDLPKPLRPVNGRPFLTYLLDQVRVAGVRRAVLALGHQPAAFDRLVKDESRDGFTVETSVESSPLGTGGALRAALPRTTSDNLLVMNGDSYVDADLAALVAEHGRRRAAASILLTEVDDVSRYGRVEIDAEGSVVRFIEKGPGGPGLINAGVYVFNRRTVDAIPEGRAVSLEREVLPSLAGRGFHATRGRFRFTDIGTPESYRDAGAFFPQART